MSPIFLSEGASEVQPARCPGVQSGHLGPAVCFPRPDGPGSHHVQGVQSAEEERSWKLKVLDLVPWLVWLSGLSVSLQTKGLPVQVPVRAQAWVVSQVPSRAQVRGNHTLMFLSLSLSLPSPRSKNKILRTNFCTWDQRLPVTDLPPQKGAAGVPFAAF